MRLFFICLLIIGLLIGLFAVFVNTEYGAHVIASFKEMTGIESIDRRYRANSRTSNSDQQLERNRQLMDRLDSMIDEKNALANQLFTVDTHLTEQMDRLVQRMSADRERIRNFYADQEAADDAFRERLSQIQNLSSLADQEWQTEKQKADLRNYDGVLGRVKEFLDRIRDLSPSESSNAADLEEQIARSRELFESRKELAEKVKDKQEAIQRLNEERMALVVDQVEAQSERNRQIMDRMQDQIERARDQQELERDRLKAQQEQARERMERLRERMNR